MRLHEVACPTTGMTAMQSTDAKFQSLASDYEVGFSLADPRDPLLIRFCATWMKDHISHVARQCCRSDSDQDRL